MARKARRIRIIVPLSNNGSLSISLTGAKTFKTVKVTKATIVAHVVDAICTVVGGPTGGQCDLSKSPSELPYLISANKWPTTMRNIVREVRKTYKVAVKKTEVMPFHTKPLEKLADFLVKRITNP